MARRLIKILNIIPLILIFSAPSITAKEYMQEHAVIDVRTNSGDGRYSVYQIADMARKSDARIVIATDGFLNRWQYGLWPLRNIIKKTIQTRSVVGFGIRRYLDQIRNVQAENPDMIFLSSVEVAPFYYWDGSPFGNSFNIKDWHKHILVIGLDSARDYRSLPVIGNGLSLANPFGIMDLVRLLGIAAILLAGLGIIRSGISSQPGVYERKLGVPVRYLKKIGFLVTAVAVVILINGFPFCGFKYDQYHGDRGAMPYQNLIDYVNAHGGMTFWSHPDAKNIDKVGGVNIETDEHSDLLLKTYGYTGFAVFHEGYEHIGAPDRIWDVALKDYCSGIRPYPIWAIGAMAFEKAGNLTEYMAGLRTVFLLDHFSKAGVLDAMRNGRMYISKEREAADFVLHKFNVKDPSSGAEKVMGQTLQMSGRPHILINGRFNNRSGTNVKITLIRSGEIIKIIDAVSPFAIDFEDTDAPEQGMLYYRAEICSDGLFTVTNPVFVSRK